MNQDPEQKARDNIDKQLNDCGWIIQDKGKINLDAGQGVVVRYYLTQEGKEQIMCSLLIESPLGSLKQNGKMKACI